MIEIKAIPGKLIMLGKQGENLAREVIFDVSGVRAEFGDGAFRLSAKRPGEADAYPATVTETGDTVVWTLTGADTQNAGRGQCELAYYAGETRLKTWTYDTAIARSLTGSPKTDPYDEFLDEVNRLAAEAAISQREAKNSENAAKTSEENAKASETAAKTSEDNAAEYAQAALAAEKKSGQNAENAASAAVSAGQYAQNAATSATNAASSATNAETHEKGAKDAATAAAKSAEGLADAVKRAEDAATAAQDNAGKTAADREAVAGMKTAAEAAQSNAEKAATSAAGSATAAGESATAAETSRTGAAEIKAQIDEIKGEIDQAKTDTAAAKTAAETAAATATEKAAEIANSAAQIATNTENIETNAEDIDLLRRENTELKAKTDALWKLSEGKSYDFVEDGTEAYSKDVPAGCRFAEVESIGGRTVAWNQWVDETKYKDATSASVMATISGRRITMVGTSGSNGENFNIIDRSAKTWSVSANHYYLFAGISKLTGLSLSAYNGAKAVTIAYAGSTAKNAVFKPTFSGISQLYFNTGDAGVAVDVDCAPYLIDLTQLYGSGNEPTTTSDPRIAEIIAYAEKHPEYNAGELVSAGVTDVDVQGANLFDTYPIPDAVKTLPGYGWSAGNVCNEIVRRADGWDYVQKVDSITFDGINTSLPVFDNGIYNNDNSFLTGDSRLPAIQASEYSSGKSSRVVAAGRFEAMPTPTVQSVGGDAWTLCGNSVTYSKYIYMRFPYTIKSGLSMANTVSEISQAVKEWFAENPTTIYYEIAPITTDITDLMTGALPLMTTEPGGTITMHHALADDGLTVDVPNTIKYIRDLKEVASSGTE